MARFISKYEKRQEHAVFSTWLEKVQNKIEARKHFFRMIHRLERKEEFTCFRQWRRQVALMKESEAEDRRLQNKLEKFTIMLTRNTEVIAFRAWAKNAKEQARFRLQHTWEDLEHKYNELIKHSEQQAQVISVLMNTRRIRSAFYVWHNFRANRIKARRTIAHLLLNAEKTAFKHWHTVITQTKHDNLLKSLAKASQQELEAYKRQRTEQFMRHLMQGHMARVFRGWHNNAHEIRRNRIVMQRFVKRWQNLEKTKIFLKMHAYAEKRKRDRALAAKFWSHLSMKQERMGFDQWTWVVQQMKLAAKNREREAQFRKELAEVESRATRKLEEAQKRIEKNQLESAKRLQAQQNARAKRLLQHITGDTLGKCFSAWRHEAMVESNNRRIVQLFVQKWKNQELHTLFRTWQHNVAQNVEERVTIARFAKQWQNRGIASSFRKWNHYAKYRIRKRKITARVVRLYEQKFFKSHMKHWRLQSIVERGNRLDKERIEKNTQTFIRKWKNMEIHNCMVRWKHYVENRHHLRRIWRAGAHRLEAARQQSLSHGFSQWGHFCTVVFKLRIKGLVHDLERTKEEFAAYRELTMDREESKKMEQAKRILSRLSGRAVHYCFNTWSENVSAIVSQRKLMKKFAFRMQNRMVHNLFQTWRINAKGMQRQRYILDQFVRRWKNRNLVKQFSAWKVNVKAILHERAVITKFIKQWQNRSLLKVFRRWHYKASLSAYRRTNSGRMNRLSNAFEIFCKKLALANKPNDLFGIVADYAPAVVQCKSVDIYLFSAQTGMYYTYFDEGKSKIKCPFNGHEGIVGHCAREGEPLILDDAREHESYCREVDVTSYHSDRVGAVSRGSGKLGKGFVLQYISVPVIDRDGPTVAVIKASRVAKEVDPGQVPSPLKQRGGQKRAEVPIKLDEIACEALRMIGSVVRCSPAFPTQQVQHVEQKVIEWGSQITDALKEFDLSQKRIAESIGSQILLDVGEGRKQSEGRPPKKTKKRKKQKTPKEAPLLTVADLGEEKETPLRDNSPMAPRPKKKKKKKKEKEKGGEKAESFASKIFDQIDVDRNGVIDREEFLQAIQSANALSALAEQFDAGGSGKGRAPGFGEKGSSKRTLH